MSILSDVDRKSPWTKVGLSVVYTLLAVGSITMIYPFLIMVITGTTNRVDYDHYRPIPKFFYDDDALYLKYTHCKEVNEWNGARRPYLITQGLSGKNFNLDWNEIERFPHLHEGTPEYFDRRNPAVQQRVTDWQAFKETAPEYMTSLYFWSDRNNYRNAERYQKWLKQKYGTIEQLNKSYGSAFSAFSDLDADAIKVGAPIFRFIMPFKGSLRSYVDHAGKHYQDWMEWRKEELGPADYSLCIADPWYRYNLLGLASTLERYNELCGTNYASIYEIHAARTAPENPKEREFWEEIVRYKTAYVFLRIENAQAEFEDYLAETYGTAANFNSQFNTTFASFDEIKFKERFDESDPACRSYWGGMLTRVPVEKIHLIRPESEYAAFLQEKYGSLAALNKAHGSAWNSLDEIEAPIREEDTLELFKHKWWWRLYFIVQNYWMALKFMASQGRAIINTGILVGLHVLVQLTVNPLAAYALSRYKPRYGNKLLLFFIATMAFPPTVGMIPQFLLLKNLGLLNTYWAIVLPMSAQGYYIFLLKGFFDSLPNELFEAAKIDGASELRIFYQIAVPVCKPIFAVIALNAFRVMYGAFMFAMLVCQDQARWTIMVFIYQFQQMDMIREYHVMAALTITALPTLLIFMRAQKTIIKGIVIPQMK
ncbi:MAG: ABC transporter permease subunit [Nitrospiraceae bacterium]|nr:ABC transporter permease subunit [Nitrospiraceae bacterium]